MSALQPHNQAGAPAPQKNDAVSLLLGKILQTTDSPEAITREIECKLEKFLANKGRIAAEDQELFNQGMMAYGMENDYPVLQVVSKEMRPLAINMLRDLRSAYNCHNAAEIAIIHTIVESYCRYMTLAKRQVEGQADKDLRKDLDYAQRQMLTAIRTLQALKQTFPSIQFIAKNAFVAGNQQFNFEQEGKV